MAERYPGRYPGDHYGHEPSRERGVMDRASDEVRSWMGDDAAERRREMDDQMRERERERARLQNRSRPSSTPEYGWTPDEERWGPSPRRDSSAERGWTGERWEEPRRWSGDQGRGEYDRTGAAYRGWNEPNLGYRPAPGFGPSHSQTAESGWSRQGHHADTGYDRGSFAGRGPKGYQRTDSRIHEDVCDRLTDDPYLDAGEVEVNVAAGEVVLSGWVKTRDDKRRAEDLAEHISGVREVRNNLRIGKGSTELMNKTPS